MSDLSFSNPSAASHTPPDRTERQARAARRAHEKTLRFHLLLNLGFALAATWVLKLDGPYYADGISAGLFVCGCFVSLWSRRSISDSETQSGLAHSRGLNLLYLAFTIFFVAAAVAVVYYTYIAPPEMPAYEEEGLTRTYLNVLRPPQPASSAATLS